MLQAVTSPSPVDSEFPATPSEVSSSSSSLSFPFSGDTSNALIEVIHDDKIDLEEEERFYRQFDLENEDDGTVATRTALNRRRTFTPQDFPQRPPSIFSNDIWLGDNTSDSSTFARGVNISGWTSVGDKLGGAYIVYDCVIRTCQDTTIHVHKRYSAFVELRRRLIASLPHSLHGQLPKLPPKYPWAKYRPTFLDKRRRMLQFWLTAVLLHPDIGGCIPVKDWIMA